MKIPKIDERQRKGVWVSGAQGQLDDAVGIFRFRDRLMLTQKKSQLNGMDCNCNSICSEAGGGGDSPFHKAMWVKNYEIKNSSHGINYCYSLLKCYC